MLFRSNPLESNINYSGAGLFPIHINQEGEHKRVCLPLARQGFKVKSHVNLCYQHALFVKLFADILLVGFNELLSTIFFLCETQPY